MNTLTLGTSEIESTRLAYGCMRISGAWNPEDVTDAMRAEGMKALDAAYEAGYRLFDHADIYGQGSCESIFGDWLRRNPDIRSELVIATKCGIRFPGDPHPDSPHRYDFSLEWILTSCERSLERLGIETIDLYQLHRPDLLMDPVEVGHAFAKLHFEKKVEAFGVSNFLPSTVAALQASVRVPLQVNQVEIHLDRLDCFYDGTLDQCLERNMTPLAWSPVAGGWLAEGGKVPEKHPDPKRAQALLDLLDATAKRHGVSRTAISLAWLMKHPSRIVPIVGTVKPDRIRDAATADAVELDREEWYRLLVAARGKGLP
jgi:predicted oxidoreductase